MTTPRVLYDTVGDPQGVPLGASERRRSPGLTPGQKTPMYGPTVTPGSLCHGGARGNKSPGRTGPAVTRDRMRGRIQKPPGNPEVLWNCRCWTGKISQEPLSPSPPLTFSLSTNTVSTPLGAGTPFQSDVSGQVSLVSSTMGADIHGSRKPGSLSTRLAPPRCPTHGDLSVVQGTPSPSRWTSR